MRKRWMAVVLIPVVLLAVLIVALAIGLRVQTSSFPPYTATTPPLRTFPLPEGLPEPVTRYYQTIAPGGLPVIESAVISGRVPTRIMGITFKGRFRFVHEAGRSYRHYIELTLFGQPIVKVNERYVDGVSHFELPWATQESTPELDQAANLGLWGETIWFPTVYLTDSRVRWEAVDATHARLVVPFEAGTDEFLVTFDSQTGLIAQMEAMRHKDGAKEKIRWLLNPREWKGFHGVLLPAVAAVTWEDEGTPWAVFSVEEIVYNADVSAYVRQRGL